MYKIKTLEHTKINELYVAHEAAFREYEVQRTKTELEVMLHRRGYIAGLSFGAFDGDKLVSFTLNGIGIWNGLRTAYDTSTGTLKEYRGLGLAGRIFNESLPYLKEAGITQYLLEVLQHNNPAVTIYRKTGFTVTREFNYFKEDIDKVRPIDINLPPGIELRVTDTSLEKKMAAMWDFTPSWQNNMDAINRKHDDFVVISAFDNDIFYGYGIIEPTTGDIPQLAVSKAYRRQGIGTAIFNKLLAYNKHNAIKVINTEVSCGHISAFIERNGIPLRGTQFEMAKPI